MAGFDRNSRHANNMHGLINLARQEPGSGSGSGSGSTPTILTAATRIACRACGRIFKCDKALYNHMELHLMLNEEDTRRKVLLSHLPDTPRTVASASASANAGLFNQNPTFTGAGTGLFNQNPVHNANPFSIGSANGNTRNLDHHLLQTSSAATATPPVSFRSRNNNYMAAPPTQAQQQASSSAGAGASASASAGGGAVKVVYVPVVDPRHQCFTRPFLNQLEASLLMEGMASISGKEVAEDDQSLDLALKL